MCTDIIALNIINQHSFILDNNYCTNIIRYDIYATDIDSFIAMILMLYDTDIDGFITMIFMLYVMLTSTALLIAMIPMLAMTLMLSIIA